MEITNRNKTTNETYKKVYQLWRNIIQRCTNNKNPYYKNYGGKGVTVCERWLTLDNFIYDIDSIEGFDFGLFMEGKLSLDKDKNGGKEYSLNNCRFVSKEFNNRIKPNQQVKFIAISPDGIEYESFNQSEFAIKHNLDQSKISRCLKTGYKHRGWTFAKI